MVVYRVRVIYVCTPSQTLTDFRHVSVVNSDKKSLLRLLKKAEVNTSSTCEQHDKKRAELAAADTVAGLCGKGRESTVEALCNISAIWSCPFDTATSRAVRPL